MVILRRASERGQTEIDWLDSRHTFSFGDYYDPQVMGFRVLRVLNDDRVAAGGGFPTHAHRDMEILTYVLEGALEHKDSLGTGSVIRPGEVQRMSAGTGVRHSEQNASRTEPVHFLQIWVLPERAGMPPGYEQKAFADAELRGKLRLVASNDGRDGSVTVHQDTSLYIARLAAGETARHVLGPGRSAYVHVASGELTIGGEAVSEGDGAAMMQETAVELAGRGAGGEVLVFDMP